MPEPDPKVEQGADLDLAEFDGMELEIPDEPQVEPPEPEGTVEDKAEEAQETPEGTEPVSPPVVEGVPDFSSIPDEFKEAAKREAQRLSDKRVADLQRSWQSKLEAANAYEEFNRQWENDPAAVMNWFEDRLPKSAKQQPPPEPGPMPNPIDDPDGNARWWEARLARQQYDFEKKLAAVQQDAIQQVKPALEMVQKSKAEDTRRQIQAALEVDQTTFTEIEQEAQAVANDPIAAWKLIKEVTALRKEKTAKAAEERKASDRARRGAEEKPGLSKTGARHLRHQPTGDVLIDTSAELDEMFPDLSADLSNLPRK